jgi:hypothetical protein
MGTFTMACDIYSSSATMTETELLNLALRTRTP